MNNIRRLDNYTTRVCPECGTFYFLKTNMRDKKCPHCNDIGNKDKLSWIQKLVGAFKNRRF